MSLFLAKLCDVVDTCFKTCKPSFAGNKCFIYNSGMFSFRSVFRFWKIVRAFIWIVAKLSGILFFVLLLIHRINIFSISAMSPFRDLIIVDVNVPPTFIFRIFSLSFMIVCTVVFERFKRLPMSLFETPSSRHFVFHNRFVSFSTTGAISYNLIHS